MPNHPRWPLAFAAFSGLAWLAPSPRAEAQAPVKEEAQAPAPLNLPKTAGAWGEGAQAIANSRLPGGAKVPLSAAEPMLATPVAFGVDGRNRFYVAETFRHTDGV